MVAQTRKKSKDATVTDFQVTPASNKPASTDLPPHHRPDLTRITTSTAPSSSIISTRRESDILSYSASTPSKSAKTPHTPSISTQSEQAQSTHNPSIQVPSLHIRCTMSQLTILSQAEEDDLHQKRLLNIEEKPFKRIQKRLLASSNPIQEYLRRRPIDAPTTGANGEVVSDEEQQPNGTNRDSSATRTEEELDVYKRQLETFQHATLHDFSALNTSLARLQFLLSSNERERERYAKQSDTITDQHSSTRENTSQLRTRLTEAKEQLQIRKGYDVLAEKVLYANGKSGEKSKTREDLGRDSEKLKNEIDELEREGDELQSQWAERRTALQNVIGEAARLRRVVRNEPEHVEVEDDEQGDEARSEVADEGEEGEGEGEQKRRDDEDEQEQEQDHLNMLGVDGRDGTSNMGTPRPMDDGGATPIPHTGESGGLTPLPGSGLQDSGPMTPRSNMGDVEAESGSSLKNVVHSNGNDIEMKEDNQESESQLVNVPELKVDDAEKAEVSEMDTS